MFPFDFINNIIIISLTYTILFLNSLTAIATDTYI